MEDVFEAFYDYLDEAGRNPLIKLTPDEEEIVRAIEKRRYVGIYYTEGNEKKVKSGFRLIEPHVLGKGFQREGKVYNSDKKYLRAYVIMDSEKDAQANKKFPEEKGAKRKSVSKSKHLPYWRLFKVENISNWTDLKKTFSKLRPNYNPDDKLLVEIIKSVPINELKESTFLHFDEYKKNINEMKNIPTFDEFINEDYTQIINEGLDADIIKKVVNDIRRNDEDMNVTRDFVESKIKKMKLNPKDLRYTVDKILVQFGVNPMDEGLSNKMVTVSLPAKSEKYMRDESTLGDYIKAKKIDFSGDKNNKDNQTFTGKQIDIANMMDMYWDMEYDESMNEGYKYLEPSTKIRLQNKITGDKIPGYGYYGGVFDQDFTASYDTSSGECAFAFDDGAVFVGKTKELSLNDFDDIIGKVQKEKNYKKYLTQNGFEDIE